jgi:photosystem II stability/assembly factor-like uncharacterized protein
MEFSATRYLNDRLEKVGGFIERDEWIDYVADSQELESDAERSGVSPMTGGQIAIAAQPDVGWLVDGESRIAVQYNDGDLWGEGELSTSQRQAVMRIARDFQAVVVDEDHQLVDW